MSGRIVREVIDAAEQLRAAGLGGHPLQALVQIAEECRDDSRVGSVPYSRVAAWLGKSPRTAERAVGALVKAGVVVVARHGGGRYKAVNQYYVPPLAGWVPGVSHVTHGMAGVPEGVQPPLMAGVPTDDENSRHSRGGGSSAGSDERTPATHGLAGVPEAAEANSRQHAEQLPPSMDVRCSVVPEVLLGGTTDVTTDRANVPDSVTPPEDPSTKEPAPHPAPAGSRCGRPDCRAPAACGPCGDARRAHPVWLAERSRAASQQARLAAAARAAAIAACPVGCDDRGYLGAALCDHDPGKAERNRRGRALVDAQLRGRARSRADLERAQQDHFAELDAFQAGPGDDPSHVPRGASDAAVQPNRATDQREEVA